MNLFIRIQDGQPFEHPIMEKNFREAFPDIDTSNLPSNFARFIRVEAPPLGPYETNQRVQYEIGDDGICRDVWYCDNLSAEEITAKQNAVKTWWANGPNYASWTFDEESCTFIPPTPYPETEGDYEWDEDTLSWVEVT